MSPKTARARSRRNGTAWIRARTGSRRGKTTFADGKLHIEINAATTLDVTLSSDGHELTGTFTQGAPIPITLKRVDKIESPKRPQEPKPPFPYDSEDVTYAGSSPNITLAATLTKPRGAGPFPAALMITGSGPQNRDEEILGHKPFLVIADYLSRRGIAVLRIDDRGMGKSTGSSPKTTISEMADDIVKGIEFLKTRQEIDAKRIGVIGHSEGGAIGPLAATRSRDISFVVMLAGPGVIGRDVMTLQGEKIMRAQGAPEAAIARSREAQQIIFETLFANREADDKTLLAKLMEQMPKLLDGVPESQRKAAEPAMRAEFSKSMQPEMRSFLYYDPQPILRQLKVPVLALNGSRDTQIVPEQNLPAIVNALTAGDNQDFAAIELPGLNHLFQHCKVCAPSEMGELTETFAPEALEILGQWLARHTPRP